MLTSDSWQPAVLQLLPFSSNHALQHPTPSFSPPSTTPSTPTKTTVNNPNRYISSQENRGFPVLAVTRKDKHDVTESSRNSSRGPGVRGWAGGGRGGEGGWSSSPPYRSREVPERLTRSHTVMDAGRGVSSQPRAKSEYVNRHSGSGGGGGGGASGGKSKANGLHSREQTTCSMSDMTEHVAARVGFRPATSSPDSGVGNLRHSSYVTSSGGEIPGNNGGGGTSRGFPKPAVPPNALTPSNNSAAVVIGPGSGSGSGGTGEGRYVVSKNGMWRSVTLTPGEMELKKHRDLLEKVTQSASSLDSKTGNQYLKLNVRDLPRSTTPVNDHDPDKLNMKQVIAFLQSKGKSQADAVELPRGLRGKETPAMAITRTLKSGILRGSMRKTTPSSTAAEVILRTSARLLSRESMNTSPPPPGQTQSGEGRVEAGRTSSSSLPSTRNPTSRAGRAMARVEHRDFIQEKVDSNTNASTPRLSQKRPFRLHRFLTMVPSARDPSNSPPPAPVNSSPLYTAVPLVPPPKSGHKDRTLCLDVSPHSKAQSTQVRGEWTDSRASMKPHYRLAAARPRPSSLHVEQDVSETRWKLSADFSDRDTAYRRSGHVKHGNKGDSKNVIRLPFVMVDSEDEDAGVGLESNKATRYQKRQDRARKGSSQKSDAGKKTPLSDEDGDEGLEADWPTEVKENMDSNPHSHLSSPSPLGLASSSSLLTASHSDLAGDQTQVCEDVEGKPQGPFHVLNDDSVSRQPVGTMDQAEDYVDKLLEGSLVPQPGGVWGMLPDGALDLNQNPDMDQTPTRKGKHASNKKVRVTVPSHNRHAKNAKHKSPDCVTLSLRKERHRTREWTYMTDMAGRDVLSDDTCAARVNSESVEMSLKSDDIASWAS